METLLSCIAEGFECVSQIPVLRMVSMKQITNKEYEEWQKYKEEKAKGHILMPDTLRFICAANDYDPTKIGQHFLEVLPKVCPSEEEHKLHL